MHLYGATGNNKDKSSGDDKRGRAMGVVRKATTGAARVVKEEVTEDCISERRLLTAGIVMAVGIGATGHCGRAGKRKSSCSRILKIFRQCVLAQGSRDVASTIAQDRAAREYARATGSSFSRRKQLDSRDAKFSYSFIRFTKSYEFAGPPREGAGGGFPRRREFFPPRDSVGDTAQIA